MTTLTCPCGRTFEAIVVGREIQIRCEVCEPLTAKRLQREAEKERAS